MHHSGRGRAGGGGRLIAGAVVLLLLLLAACSGSTEEAGRDDEAGDGVEQSTTSGTGDTTTTTEPAPTTERYTLANGLDVILRPVPDAERVALLVSYDVGERHDPPGQSGLAHVTEQVYSTAATGLVPPRAAFEYLDRYPDGWFSETGDDFTVMGRVFAPGQLDAEITEAAARMLSITATPEDLERERARVLNDIDAILVADPAVAARTRAEELIQPSPNGGNQMGIPAQVARLELNSVVDRLAALYKPVNATLVIVGGFDPEQARATIEQFFALVPEGQPAGEGAPWGLAGFGEVASVIVVPREGAPPGTSTASVGYLAPPPDDPTYPAFLTHVARMRAAGEEAGMDVNYRPLQTPGVTTVTAALAPGETEEAVVERIRSWVAAELAVPIDDEARGLAADDLAGTFGAGGYPDEQLADDPWSVALSLARVGQLGVDPDELAEAIADLTDDDLAASAAATFPPERSAAAVVLVEPA